MATDHIGARPVAHGFYLQGCAMPLKEGRWCYRCGAYDTEPAGDKCKNPMWHVQPQEQVAEEDEPKDKVRLPYAED